MVHRNLALIKSTIKKKILGWVPVAHACNPSYSGGRDEEDRGSKPARQIAQQTLSQK
jgi:hypothetical protein